jgi:3-phosphoshikimate 1-carboxyvinyltransferase
LTTRRPPEPSEQPWSAPVAGQPVNGEVRLPGSKSMTNRALVLAALGDGESVLQAPLRSRDTDLMAKGLQALGVPVAAGPNGSYLVSGTDPPFRPTAPAVDVGNAGTVARFLTPLAALVEGNVFIDGDPPMRARPLRPLLCALGTLGVTIDADGRDGLPLVVRGQGWVRGGAVTVDASASSQFISGLLLAAPAYRNGVRVRHHGPRLPSRGHLAMTVRMLRAAGATVDDSEPHAWAVSPGRLRAGRRLVEPDLSSAAPFLAAALVTNGRVTVADWPTTSDQPGAALPALLGRMGATYTLDANGLTVEGTGEVHGLDADLRDVSELVPVLTAIAAVASGPSRFRGVAHMRGQETDRLAALATQIGRLGGAVAEMADGLTITPRQLHGGVFATYDDHRLAMAAAVLGLVVPGIGVENVATTAKTLPGFTSMWSNLLSGPTC